MRGLKLLESELAVVFGTNLSFWDLGVEICNRAEELSLVCAFEVSELIAIEECNEVRDC